MWLVRQKPMPATYAQLHDWGEKTPSDHGRSAWTNRRDQNTIRRNAFQVRATRRLGCRPPKPRPPRRPTGARRSRQTRPRATRSTPGFSRAAVRPRPRSSAASGALHRKGQLGAAASFEVLGNLPESYAAGFFAPPGSYRAYVRFSNGSHMQGSDRGADVRGLAVKVIGVPGKKLIPGLEV